MKRPANAAGLAHPWSRFPYSVPSVPCSLFPVPCFFSPSSRIAICKIRPRLLLLPRIAQQERRMVGHNQLGPAELVHASAQPGERLSLPQQIRGRRRAQRHNHLRPHHLNLLVQELHAGVGLVRLRRAIPRWPAFHNVGNVDLFALQPHRRDHVVQ